MSTIPLSDASRQETTPPPTENVAGDVVADATELPPRILLYDGVCGMCNSIVQVLMDLDKDERFFYAPLQGDTAAELRQRHQEIPDELETMVYVEEDQVYLRSDAVLKAAAQMRFPWRLGRFFLWVPRFLRNAVYGLVARYRYKVFGKYESCRLPSPSERARFLR